MTEERKIQLGVEVDATGAKKGFDQVKQDAQSMAQAVGQAGEKAGAGLEGGMVAAVKRATAATGEAAQQVMTWTGLLKQNMGPAMKEALDAGATHAEAHSAAIKKIAAQWQVYKDTVKSAGATAANAGASVAQSTSDAASASDKLTASQARLLATLERESIMITQGKAAWREHQASLLGVSEAATPYIAKIKQAETAQVNLGMSAKQTAFALRGIPAQFTDIVTSLQGGQKPITVLLQQGGQLKDMFGGIGPAAKAMGGYVLGLVNPFTVAAAAAVGLGVAYAQGSKEADGYRNALILTGNAAGSTADQMSAMAERIGRSVGTQGSAAAAIAQLAGTGKVAGQNLEYFSRVAVQMEKTVGQSVEKTAKDLAELGKSPLEASERLNDKYQYLTASVYAQIKALQDQGREEEAATVAQNAYARSFDDRTKEITANLGLIEKGWKYVADEAKKGWDAILNVGRSKTGSDKSSDLSSQIEAMRSQIAISGENGRASLGSKTTFGDELKSLLDQQAILQENIRLQNRSAEATAAQNQKEQTRIEWLKEGDKFLSKHAQMEREITKARTEGAAAGIAQADIEKRIADIREKYKEKGGQVNNDVADLKAKLKAEQEYLEQLKLSGGAAEKLNEGEKDAIKYAEQLKGKIDAKTRARLEESLSISKQRAETLTAIEAEKDEIKATEEAAKSHVKYIASLSSGLDKMKADVEAQRMHNAQIGLSKEAIAALEAAKLEEQATTLEGIAIKQMDKNLDSEQYDILKAQAQALRDLASEKRIGASKQASFDAAEEHRKAWEKANDQISQSLTHAIMRGGKSAGEYLKDYFRTLILRPVVQMIANPVTRAINSAFGSTAGGFPQGANLVNAGSNLYSAATSMSSMGNTAAQLYQYGSTALTGGTAAVSTGAAGTGWVSAEGGASYLSTGASSIGSAFSTAVPYLAAAYAIYSIAKSLDHSGTYHTGALAEYSAATGLLTGSNGTHAGPRSGDTNYGTGFGGVDFSQQTADFVGGISKSIVGILDSTASTFGKTAGYTAATAFADDTSKDGAWGALLIQKMGQSVVNWNDTRNSSWAPREFGDGEAGRTQYLAELSKSVRTALDDIGLPGWAQSMLDNLGNAPALTDLAAVVDKINATQKALVSMGDAIAGFTTLSDAAVTALVSASGGVDSFVAGMNAFYEGYYTDAEKIANVSNQVSDALSAVGLAMPATREEFRALVEQELALGEAGAPAVAALLSVSGAFGQVADYSKQLADQAIASAQEIARTRSDLEIQIMQLSGDASGALAAQRAKELASLDASLRPLQERIYLLQDEKTATDAAKVAAQTALDNAMKGVDAAFSAVQRAVDAERKSITDAYNEQIKSINASITDVTGSVGKLTSLSNSLRSTIDRMRLPDQYGADRASAQAQIQTAIAIARAGGVLPDAESLSSALNIVSQPSEQLFSSFKDYQADFLKTKNSIADLADITDLQKSVEERTLSTLQDQLRATEQGYQDEMTRLDGVLSAAQLQIDTLRGIDQSVISVAAAIANLQIRIGTAASAQANLSNVTGTTPDSIAGLYSNILGRAPDTQGAAWWQNAISTYQMPWDQVVTDFIGGAIHTGGADEERARQWAREHGIPGFAVGTSYVPYDMTARIHAGEEITPRPYVDIQRADRDKTNSLLSQLVEENRSMRAELSKLRSATDEGNRHLVRAANAVNGNPEAPMLVETAA